MRRAVLAFRNDKKTGPYRQALGDEGIEVVSVSPEHPIDSLDGMGLVLTGGTDIDPAIYGQDPDPRGDTPDRERDDLELKFLRQALSLDLPVLAICRGLQLFNVAHGGTLIQHMEGHRIADNGTHAVEITAGTRLACILGSGRHDVNSRHHQAAGQVGGGLAVSAISPDGFIEGLERPDRRFAVAVQWHPEDMLAGYTDQRRLFLAFREALEAIR
ncbi:MAG: gamma-glutamyl-gamma-aminobutyrate hydrolase family protein [Bryobacterales bacterium]|nr:gamma-glutamyl-gamma-aminobutyrate hydrolase family protein [Bryobacterales bacterium]MBV9400289.1 gamma-glutamyl-gamma-aminobutyrate hydrolase family protein [Bryobacterales bacterium]